MISLHIILVGMLVVGFQSTAIPDVIEAKKLIIKDDKGLDRITLSVDENTSHIRMTEKGKDHVHLYSSNGQSSLYLHQKESRVLLENSLSNGFLRIESDKNRSQYIMGTNSGYYGEKFKEDGGLYKRFDLGFDYDKFRFNLIKGLSQNVFSIINSKNSTNLSIYDNDGNKRVSIGNQSMINQYGNEYTSAVSSIHLFNQNNKTIFAAPN